MNVSTPCFVRNWNQTRALSACCGTHSPETAQPETVSTVVSNGLATLVSYPKYLCESQYTLDLLVLGHQLREIRHVLKLSVVQATPGCVVSGHGTSRCNAVRTSSRVQVAHDVVGG